MKLFGLNISRASRSLAAPDFSSLSEREWLQQVFGADDPLDGLRRAPLREHPERALVGWAYVAISRIARYAADCPWVIMRGKKPAPDSHPLYQLLRRPNPLETDSRLLQTTLYSQELWGNAFWVIERGSRKQPVELWPVPPAAMRARRWENGVPAVWEQRKNDGQIMLYPAEDVVWFRSEGPGAALTARSPVSAVECAIQCDIFVLRHYSYFFEHGASPLLSITFPTQLDETDKATLRAEWQKNYEGLKRWFRPLVLTNGAQVQTIGTSPSMSWLQLRTQLREEILAAFDCPPAIAGIFQNANFGVSIAEQRKMFWDQALCPRLNQIADDVNNYLVPQIDPEARLVYEFDRVPAMRPDYASLVAAMGQLVPLNAQGLLTTEQCRLILRNVGLLEEE